MTKYLIHILHKEDGQNLRNKEPFVVLYSPSEWPRRILNHRGYSSMKVIFKRPMVEKEIEETNASWRMKAWKYDNVQKLINDESTLLGVDHEEIAFLKQNFGKEIVNG